MLDVNSRVSTESACLDAENTGAKVRRSFVVGGRDLSLSEIVDFAVASPETAVLSMDLGVVKALEDVYAKRYAASWTPSNEPQSQAIEEGGDEAPVEVWRGYLILRAASVMNSSSGIRPTVIQQLCALAAAATTGSKAPKLGGTDEDAFNWLLSRGGLVEKLSQGELDTLRSGLCFSTATAAMALHLAKATSVLSDAAVALTMEAAQLPVSLIVGSTGQDVTYGPALACRSVLRWLLEESKTPKVTLESLSPKERAQLNATSFIHGNLCVAIDALEKILQSQLKSHAKRTDKHHHAVSTPGPERLLPILVPVQSLQAALHEIVEAARTRTQSHLLPRMKRTSAASPLPPKPAAISEAPVEPDPLSTTNLEAIQQSVREYSALEGASAVSQISRLFRTAQAAFHAVITEVAASLAILEDMNVSAYRSVVEKIAKGSTKTNFARPMGKPTQQVREFFVSRLSCLLQTPENRNPPMSKSATLISECIKKPVYIVGSLPELEKIMTPLNQGTRKPKVAKGAQDFTPERMAVRSLILEKVREILHKYGAVEIDTPVFELMETLMGKYGEEQKLIYALKDQGGELLALRYDLTVPFARYCGSNNVTRIKRFHIGKVYRRDEPQVSKGRFREFYQCDIDISGTYDNMIADAEVLSFFDDILRTMEPVIGPFMIVVNHRLLLDGMMGICGVPKEKFRAICSAIDKLDKEPWDKVCEEMVHQKGIGVEVANKIRKYVEMKGSREQLLDALKRDATLTDETSETGKMVAEALRDLEHLFGLLDAQKVPSVVFDLSLARGLDYYTGLIFEARLVGAEMGSIGGGGRYDKLIGMFSARDIPSIGGSLGIERIFQMVERKLGLSMVPPQEQTNPTKTADAKTTTPQTMAIREGRTEVCVCSIGDGPLFLHKRMELVKELREAGIPTDFLYQEKAKLVKQLTKANDERVPYAVIFGEDELRKGTVKVRQLTYAEDAKEQSAVEEEVSRTEVAMYIKERLRQTGTSTDRLCKLLFSA